MLNLKTVRQFKKDIRKYKHNQILLDEFEEVINNLRNRKKLADSYFDHPLIGEYKGMRECHVQPDVLLIYWISEKTETLYLERIGSHSELFR